MKLQILSDLHTEFHRDQGRSFIRSIASSDTDMLILAGDLTVYTQLENTFNLLFQHYNVILYVPGNHEYYYASPSKVHKRMNKLVRMYKDRGKTLHWLNNKKITIHGQKFIGGTFWFRDVPGNERYTSLMNDFLVIKDFIPWVYDENSKFRELLAAGLEEGDVVITHHLPSMTSVPKAFKTSSLNRFFVCEVDDLIKEKKPAYWIHGHSHGSSQYIRGETHVICNPFGYAGHAENWDFGDKLIIEV